MSGLFQRTKTNSRRYSVAIFIGIIAGIISAMVKSGVETILPPRTPETLSPPVKLLLDLGANATSEVYTYSEQVVNWGGNGVHVLFSIFCGIMYCILSEIFPKVKIWQGILFGILVAFFAHGVILPTFHLSAPLWDLNIDGILSEIVGTCLWVWTIEIVRRDLRNRITKKPDPELQ